MRNAQEQRHRDAVQRLAEQYRARGYDVIIEPEEGDRPGFLGEYRPDLIARSTAESVIVEVKLGTELAHGARLQPIAERVAQQPGWRFSLVVLGEGDPGKVVPESPPLPVAEISERIARAKTLSEQGSPDASFLLLWSSMEALLRVLAERAHIPLGTAPTSMLIRELYSAGELSREQFDVVMQMLSSRNSLVHGFSSPVGQAEADKLYALSEDLLNEASRTS